ncbi:hypothetical protein E3U23_09390 [Erythrobacter litoralis]|uniref:hypothetical protein n=1 Tax=Erythrobacter litoralis TaxID=39960 RepID=UPI002434B01C|nr:hypothetical protein [Erythrobacter litoralis]MDG6079404.1 hypothetical protein [Erythrobacter litoralis]
MNQVGRFLAAIFAIGALSATPALAADETDVWLEAEARAAYSDRAVVDGDSIEASGGGVGIDAGFEWKNGRTAVQFDLGAAVFEFTDEDRDMRTSTRAVASLAHQVADDIAISVSAGHWDDITTLEARRTDQDAIAVEVGYEKRPHRVRASAQYREREYESVTPSRGNGMRYDADYTYRFGSWYWARVDLRAEDIDSDHTRRGYERHTIRASFSAPVDEARLWRVRPQIEWRQWEYDDRRVLENESGALRKDAYLAPEIGFSYGKLSGLKARLRAAYQFRTSNDPRYRADAPYLDFRIGYRF